MGILDKLKKKKSADSDGKSARGGSASGGEETVIGPDGKLTTVTKKVDAKEKKPKPKKEDTGNAYRVLIKPLITEKGSSLSVNNQYVFEVAPSANKIEIKKAIRKVYGVNPKRVNIISVSGKHVRYGKSEGSTKFWKKAIVFLPAGQKIDIQEGL